MRHSRQEVIERTEREFLLLDDFVGRLTDADWRRSTRREPGQDVWTVKDALVHVTYWKADVARFALGRRRLPEERGLTTAAYNHLIYERWRHRPAGEVIDWHRDVHREVIAALLAAPEAWFSGRERAAHWPADIDSHIAAHRVRDMERVVQSHP